MFHPTRFGEGLANSDIAANVKQLSRRDLMALGTAAASAELQERKERVAAAMVICRRLEAERSQ